MFLSLVFFNYQNFGEENLIKMLKKGNVVKALEELTTIRMIYKSINGGAYYFPLCLEKDGRFELRVSRPLGLKHADQIYKILRGLNLTYLHRFCGEDFVRDALDLILSPNLPHQFYYDQKDQTDILITNFCQLVNFPVNAHFKDDEGVWIALN